MRKPSSSGAVTAAGILALLVSAIVGIVAFLLFRLCWPSYGTLQSEISRAFAETASSVSSGRYEWECSWGCENESWIHSLPPIAGMTCYDRLFPHGACCGAVFDGGSFQLYSEIHVFRVAGGGYKISFYSYPMCTNPGSDPLHPSFDVDSVGKPKDKFFRCDDKWRT